MKKISLRVPATSANCGPGFDTLGMACTLYNELSFELLENKVLQLEVVGEGAEALQPDARNLAFQAFLQVWQALRGSEPVGLKVTMHNRIPMARGLGTSSSAIVAGVYAANALCGRRFSREELLRFAAELEGHPDNVAPALYGGFTVSYTDAAQHAQCLRFLPALKLKFIAVVPERRLATALARQAIPAQVPHRAAVFNTSRAALLVSA